MRIILIKIDILRQDDGDCKRIFDSDQESGEIPRRGVPHFVAAMPHPIDPC
jgi:hypothetical protein